jgi:uroporphyrin-III C-methyltransferase
VGAGPGATDLITLRGLQAIRKADVILYDALANADLLAEAPEAQKIFVGKRCGRHSMEQLEINRLLVANAREGRTVVHLKGGDPMVFGRGAEESLACAEAGIDFELVPGVSSALGAANYSGVPLTHRGMADSVAFVTAHGPCGGKSLNLNWKRLARNADTLVIFMGGLWLEGIAQELRRRCLRAATPVAVISKATHSDQQTVVGTLENIAQRVANAGLPTPMLIIVGKVASLSHVLNWFENQRKAITDGISLTPVPGVSDRPSPQ